MIQRLIKRQVGFKGKKEVSGVGNTLDIQNNLIKESAVEEWSKKKTKTTMIG